MTRKIDKQTGEIIKIQTGGLYSAFPIPAYRALGIAEEYKAQQILLCLVSYLGSNSNKVWPTYDQISDMSGIHRSSIRKSLDVLESFGFIKIIRSHTGKNIKNVYFISDSCYHVSQFNQTASKFKIRLYVCTRCAHKIADGEFKAGPIGNIHFGCGGQVKPLAGIKYSTVL